MENELDNLTKIFNLGRAITKDSSFPYIHLGFKEKLDNYKLISSGELIIRGKDLVVPEYIKDFVIYNDEVLMIAEILNNKVVNITFRTIKGNKEFMKLGNTKAMLYGLGKLGDNFKYGTPILLVEGHLDRDVMANTIYPYTLGIMTNRLSKVQVELLTGLTNKFILMLDNDKAGETGTKNISYYLQGNNIDYLIHDPYLKDAGDLVKLELTNKHKYKELVELYKAQISSIL